MIQKPKLSLVLEEYKQEEFESDRISDLIFGEKIECEELTQSTFDSCLFNETDFSGKNLEKCAFIDCIFTKCDFSNQDMTECNFRRCEFRQCKLVGTDLSKSIFNDCLLLENAARYSNFSGCRMQNCLFECCNMDLSAFNEAVLKKVEISRCSWSECEFIHTSLKDLDFSDSVLEGITVYPTDLKGIIVNSDQALNLVSILGIKIKD